MRPMTETRVQEIIREVIRGEFATLTGTPGLSYARGQRDIRWLIGQAARAAVKDYLDEIREAVKIEERIIRGEPVTDAEMNFLNLHRFDQMEGRDEH